MQWCRKIQSIQNEKMTPEQRQHVLQAAERQREILQCQVVSSEVQKRMKDVQVRPRSPPTALLFLLFFSLSLQSATWKAGRSFSAREASAPGAQAAMASADAVAISRAGSEVSAVMRLACKEKTPIMRALSFASAKLSVADDDEGGGSAEDSEAMHDVRCSRILI
jgi:hypothetical protein